MHRGDPFAAVLEGVFEREPGDPRGRFLGDDLEGLDDPGDHDVLEAGVEVFGILPDDDEVDAGKTGRNAGEIGNGPEIRVQLEILTETDVDRLEASADGGRQRPLQRGPVLPDRRDHFRGEGVSLRAERLLSRAHLLEIDAGAALLQDREHALAHLGADAVPAQQRHPRRGGRHAGRAEVAATGWVRGRIIFTLRMAEGEASRTTYSACRPRSRSPRAGIRPKRWSSRPATVSSIAVG